MQKIIEEQEANEAEKANTKEFMTRKKERLLLNENQILSGGGGGGGEDNHGDNNEGADSGVGGGENDGSSKLQQKQKMSGPGKRKLADGTFEDDTWAKNLISQWGQRPPSSRGSSKSGVNSTTSIMHLADPITQMWQLEVYKQKKIDEADEKIAKTNAAEDRIEGAMVALANQKGVDNIALAEMCMIQTAEGINFVEAIGIEILINVFCRKPSGPTPRFAREAFLPELEKLGVASTERSSYLCHLKLFYLLEKWKKEIEEVSRREEAATTLQREHFSTPGSAFTVSSTSTSSGKTVVNMSDIGISRSPINTRYDHEDECRERYIAPPTTLALMRCHGQGCGKEMSDRCHRCVLDYCDDCIANC